MGEPLRVRATVTGRVQGVGFRWFTQREAQALGVAGWVRNKPDGSVEVEAEGERKTLENFLGRLRKGPLGSQVKAVEHQWLAYKGDWQDFEIQ